MTGDPLFENHETDAESEFSSGTSPMGRRLIIGVIMSVFLTSGIAAFWVYGSIQASRGNVTSMNNLRQVVLAELSFESDYQKLPVDDHGLSWRAHIMEFIIQDGVSQYLRLDEPWDSPNNIELLAGIPETMRSLDHEEVEYSKTMYLRPIGNGAFPKEGEIKVDAIRDGMSNTIILAEYDPGAALIWMAPGDHCFDPDDPKKDLGKARSSKQFLVSFADGSTHQVSNDIDPEVLKSAFTIDSGDSFRGF